MTSKYNFEIYSAETNLPIVKEIKDGRRDYVYWGENNLFPQYIIDLYQHSALFETIVRGISDYVMGNDVVSDLNVMNKDRDTIQDIVENSVMDYIMFNGFAMQIFRDSDNKITEIYNIDFQNLRVGKDDNIYYSPDWSKQNAKVTSYPLFDFEKKQKNSIFYFKGKGTPQTNCYPIPTYYGALSDIRTSVEISNFHLNSVLNGFNGNLIINLNSGEVDDDTKKKVENKFKDKFCGTGNAGKFVLNFNENKESAITLERLQSDDFADRYNTLEKTITSNIFTAFRSTPNLFGLPTETTGFNSQEYEGAFKIYQKTVIAPIQKIIERAFGYVFNNENVIKFVPFSLDKNIGE